MSIDSSASTASRSVDHSVRPCCAASASNAWARRPTSTGSGQSTWPSPRSRPPCSRIARIERTRCCRYPIRPVTPFMAMRTVLRVTKFPPYSRSKRFLYEMTLACRQRPDKRWPPGTSRRTAMTVTLADVAARARVSPATVSRVLNGNYPVAASTRERVLRAVDELDYVLNGPASSLAAATSDLVGILVNDIADPFFGIMAGAAQTEIGGQEGT